MRPSLGTVAVLITCSTVVWGASSAAGRTARAFTSQRLSVVTRGQGPDIILIPGLASHRDVWASAAALLEDRYRLHLVQVNGFTGFAPGANAEGPVSAPVAEEIVRYIRETGIGRPAVIGHSMGGSMGMMMAARHPDVVGRLMIVDAVPFMGVMFGGTSAEGVSRDCRWDSHAGSCGTVGVTDEPDRADVPDHDANGGDVASAAPAGDAKRLPHGASAFSGGLASGFSRTS
jgi:pimeloyl-ACP methyl ester carboxylesterase